MKLDIPQDFQKSKLFGGGLKIVRILRNNGFEALWAGGIVRDLFMGTVPTDIDIATSAEPEQVMALFKHTIAVGKQFGVIVVPINGYDYEVATFRKDGKYVDGRRPQSVIYSTAKEDAQRRDFTINGLFYDPQANQVYDYVNGVQDLRSKIIRAIGNPMHRFAEDKLRLIRAIRFASRFGFEIENQTWEAIRHQSDMIGTVSMERVHDEWLKMFSKINIMQGQLQLPIQLMLKARLVQPIVPELQDVYQSLYPDRDLFDFVIKTVAEYHNSLMQQSAAQADPLVVVSLMMHAVTFDAAFFEDQAGLESLSESQKSWPFFKVVRTGVIRLQEVLERLKFSNQEKNTIIEIVQAKNAIFAFFALNKAEQIRVYRDPLFAKQTVFYRSLCVEDDAGKQHVDNVLLHCDQFEPDLWPKVFLNGNDLKQMGLSPGPLFKELLYELENEQLMGNINTKDQAIAWIQDRIQGD